MNRYMNQVALVGLDDFGQSLLWNLTRNCFSVSCYDLDKNYYPELKKEGFSCFDSVDSLLNNLFGQKIVFVTGKWCDKLSLLVSRLIEKLPSESIIIDCTNSYFKECVIKQKRASAKKIAYLDASIIGTLDDVTWAFSIMVGGNPLDAGYFRDIISPLLVQDGYLYTGSIGSAHYSKMVHDGIQNSQIQSIIEGIKMFDSSFYCFNKKKIIDFFNKSSMISGKTLNYISSTFSDQAIDELKREKKEFNNLSELDLNTLSSFISTSVNQNTSTPTITASSYSTINLKSKKSSDVDRLLFNLLINKFKEVED